MNHPALLSMLALTVATSFGCAGQIEDVPPPVETGFSLRVNGKAVQLEQPTDAQRFQVGGDSFVSGSTRRPISGDYVETVGFTLNEPLGVGAHSCQQDPDGVFRAGTSLYVDRMIVHADKLTDCVIRVRFASPSRVVGSFAARTVSPQSSELEGDFDLPIVDAANR